jgi:hypothetical protein
MALPRSSNRADIIRWGVFAGAAGGLAEVLWVSLYASVSGLDAAVVARGVTTAVGLQTLVPHAPAAAGIAIHMALAVALGVALASVWQVLPANLRKAHLAFGAAALTCVWAMNFFVVLPIVSPDFVHVVPYSVSLVSKLLFGLAAAHVLHRCTEPALRHVAVPTRRRRPF